MNDEQTAYGIRVATEIVILRAENAQLKASLKRAASYFDEIAAAWQTDCGWYRSRASWAAGWIRSDV